MPFTAYSPKPGYGPNPLRKHRNVPCPCGSGRKAKQCHGREDFISLDDIAFIREQLALGEASKVKWKP